MISWNEVLERHYKEHLGEPIAHHVTESWRDRDVQLLSFPWQDGSTLLCTMGLTSYRAVAGQPHHEIIARVREPPDDLPFVFLNGAIALGVDGQWLRHGVCLPYIDHVAPAFAADYGKTALYFRTPPKDSPIPPAKNGPLTTTFLLASFIGAGESDLLEHDGVAALQALFSREKTDLSDLRRSPVAAYRRLPSGAVATLSVPEEYREEVVTLGGLYHEQLNVWYVPAGLAWFPFHPWLTASSRWALSIGKWHEPVVVRTADEAAAQWEEKIRSAHSPADASDEPPQLSYSYLLTSFDQTTRTVDSDLLVHGPFEYRGRMYAPTQRVVFGEAVEGAIPCAERLPVRTGQAKRDEALRLLAFLRARAPGCRDLADTDEDSIRRGVLSILAAQFEVIAEPWGNHPSGKMLRLDAIVTPKDRSGWRNKEVAFGLEFKNPAAASSKGHKQTSVMAQCLDYSLCEFPGFPHVLVFACPLPVYLREEHYFLSFVGRYGVGYVRFAWKTGLEFVLGNMVLWSEAMGPRDIVARSMFSKHYGNRGASDE